MTGETDRHISGNKITTRNKPMNSYYMLKWTGKIYQTQEEVDNSPHVKGAGPGDLVFEDISGPEGKPDGVIDANDRQILGTEYPTWTFGANLSFGYKGINISADFRGLQMLIPMEHANIILRHSKVPILANIGRNVGLRNIRVRQSRVCGLKAVLMLTTPTAIS